MLEFFRSGRRMVSKTLSYTSRVMNPRNGEKAPFMSNSKSQSWRWLSVIDGNLCASCFSEADRASPTINRCRFPPYGWIWSLTELNSLNSTRA